MRGRISTEPTDLASNSEWQTDLGDNVPHLDLTVEKDSEGKKKTKPYLAKLTVQNVKRKTQIKVLDCQNKTSLSSRVN